jgi:hypothetical protein
MKRLALLVLITACTKVDSEDILTHGMNAQIEARGDAFGNTTVTTTLYLGDPINLNFVELSSGDELIATNGANSKPMQESSILNITSYSAQFSTNVADEEFEVAFIRTVDNGAPSSTVTIPDPFDIEPYTNSVSRAADMTIAWSAPGSDKMEWSVSGSCIDAAGAALQADTGGALLQAGTIKKRMSTGPNDVVPESCEATLQLTRSRDGDLDPGYGKGGSITGTQVRTTTFTTSP